MLRTKLLERQLELGLRDGQMALRLGIPRTTYSAIKIARYRISMFNARRIVKAFPDLAPFALTEDEPAR